MSLRKFILLNIVHYINKINRFMIKMMKMGNFLVKINIKVLNVNVKILVRVNIKNVNIMLF